MKKTILFILTAFLAVTLLGCKRNALVSVSEGTRSSEVEQQSQEETKIQESNKEESKKEDDNLKKYKQSPILDQNTQLPAIEERLPEEPKLANEMPDKIMKTEVGDYGGELRTVTSVIDWDADVFIMNNEALINTPGLLGEEVVPNIVKKFEVSPDEKEFTFYLREGLKWSDGQPVTIDDFQFTFEDVIFNKELTPVFPAWLCSEGKAGATPLTFKKVDAWTFKIIFDKPYGGFLTRLAVSGWRGYADILKPAHYLKKFHIKYANKDELEKLIAEAGFKPGEWVNLFGLKDILNNEMQQAQAIGFPVLYPWVLTKKENNQDVLERNPYYFKVDSEGKQLPYIDRITSSLVQDIEMVTMKTVSGEVDFCRESAALIKMPLYKENEKNGFTALVANMHNMPTNIYLNLTYGNADWKAVVQDIRFRKALNYALNRSEIIDTVYFGFAEPSTILDSTFDIDAANKLLDEMGMRKDEKGIRKTPQGKDFSILFEVGAQAPDILPMTEIVVEQWKKLGIEVNLKRIEASLWSSKISANEIQATIMWAPVNLWYQSNWGQAYWGPMWDIWRNQGGKKGEEPPTEVKEFFNSMTEMMILTPDRYMEKYKELEDNMNKNIFFFPSIKNVKQPLIVNNKLGNITDKGYAIGCNSIAELFYYKK
jgi:peptide/nickel transport system substrate-binding protein